SEGCGGSACVSSTTWYASGFTSRGTTKRAAMDSSGRFAGMFDFVSSGAKGRPDGTSVRSSSVDGRRRDVGSNVDGRASNGTRDRGIIARLFSDSETQANPPPDGCLLVG